MKTLETTATLLLCLSLAGGACRTAAPAAPTPAVAPAPAATPAVAVPWAERPELAWWRSAMATRDQRLGWWREARFGMFVHWGVYSQLGGVWEGTPVKGYAEHIQRMRKIPIPVYRTKVAAAFNPTAFDADAWIRAARDAGMGYFVITSKHHDGFAMYDSAVSHYNVVEATPWRRDPMLELKQACARHGLKFGFYYSHAFDWGERDGAGNDWDYANPGGDRLLGGERWYDGNPQELARIRRYVDGKAIPQLRELIAKYDPDILWFDTPHKLPVEENLRILRAVREAKPGIVVNGRIAQVVPGGPEARFGDYKSTADKPAEFPPQKGDWEAIPTTNESYGFHQMDHAHKPASHFVRMLAKAAARGGNVLLNVGPMGDGRLDAKDGEILAGIGAWMKVNGRSIRGTVRSPLPVQAWGESTLAGRTLYLHVLQWPAGGRLVVGGLRSRVKRAALLADPVRALATERDGDKDVVVRIPAAAPDAIDTVVAVELEEELAVDEARLLSTAVPADTLRAFDGERVGRGLAFGAGKTRDAWVHGWSHTDAALRWPVRLATGAVFNVGITYDADPSSVGGKYRVKVGDQVVTGTVERTPTGALPLGRVSLAPGAFDIRVEAETIAGGELFKLRGLVLTPVR